MDSRLEAFQRLLQIMDELREKCPWDREQTWQSLREMTLEEVYELSDAIIRDEQEEIKQELGDLILHIVFYSKIGEEKEVFDIEEVLNGICDKLVERHPHVYGEVEAHTEDDVKQNWEEIKLKEGKKSILSGIPQSMPPLIKTVRMLQKVSQARGKPEQDSTIIKKMKNREEQLLNSHKNASKPVQEEYLGNFLFSLIKYAFLQGLDPERALTITNKKFQSEVKEVEEEADKKGVNVSEMLQGHIL